MVEFQKLLHKIKEFKEGIDYTFKEQELLNNQQYEKEEVYLLQSPTIKEEARKIMFEEFEDNENGVGVFARIGKEESGKWYDYQRGDNEADQFSIKTIRPSELEKRRKEREKNRKEFEKKGKEFKESSKDKKCAFCGKEIDQSQRN